MAHHSKNAICPAWSCLGAECKYNGVSFLNLVWYSGQHGGKQNQTSVTRFFTPPYENTAYWTYYTCISLHVTFQHQNICSFSYFSDSFWGPVWPVAALYFFFFPVNVGTWFINCMNHASSAFPGLCFKCFIRLAKWTLVSKIPTLCSTPFSQALDPFGLWVWCLHLAELPFVS